MKLTKKYPLLGSSVDPESISLTIKGVGGSLVVAIVAVAGIMGVPLVEDDLTQIVNLVAGISFSAITLWGIGRKIVVAIKAYLNK